MKINKQDLKKSFKKSIISLKEFFPMLIGVLLISTMLEKSGFFNYLGKFINNSFSSVFISGLIGSISAGNPFNSYIIVESIGIKNSNIISITIFLITWITVGIAQMPAEIYFFGKKFTIVRNFLSFVFAVLGSYVIYFFISI